jgi:hypothetical protein
LVPVKYFVIRPAHHQLNEQVFLLVFLLIDFGMYGNSIKKHPQHQVGKFVVPEGTTYD